MTKAFKTKNNELIKFKDIDYIEPDVEGSVKITFKNGFKRIFEPKESQKFLVWFKKVSAEKKTEVKDNIEKAIDHLLEQADLFMSVDDVKRAIEELGYPTTTGEYYGGMPRDGFLVKEGPEGTFTVQWQGHVTNIRGDYYESEEETIDREESLASLKKKLTRLKASVQDKIDEKERYYAGYRAHHKAKYPHGVPAWPHIPD